MVAGPDILERFAALPTVDAHHCSGDQAVVTQAAKVVATETPGLVVVHLQDLARRLDSLASRCLAGEDARARG